jgi:GT2 family glycosyltransferase
MQAAKVSVIIANFNGAAHLRVCLPSLLEQTFKSIEIIVVDNSSSDDSETVAKSFGARWLGLGTNLGLAPALNRGAAIATGDLLLFVNNDMRFDREFVAALRRPFDNNGKLFATDATQLNWDGTSVEHAAARLTKTNRRVRTSTELVPGLFFFQQETSSETDVFMASAACMMVPRVLFDEIGRFDERLPLGYEDVEICWRARLLGYRTLYVPNAVCWHRVGGSQQSQAAARFAFAGVLKGRLLFATKLLPVPFVLRTWAVSIAGFSKDLARLRWQDCTNRAGVLLIMIGIFTQLVKDRNQVFRVANITPSKSLHAMLQLTSDAREMTS